jgi:hypothetical protein
VKFQKGQRVRVKDRGEALIVGPHKMRYGAYEVRPMGWGESKFFDESLLSTPPSKDPVRDAVKRRLAGYYAGERVCP